MEMNNGVQNFNFDLASLMTPALPLRGHADVEKTVEALFDRVCEAAKGSIQ